MEIPKQPNKTTRVLTQLYKQVSVMSHHLLIYRVLFLEIFGMRGRMIKWSWQSSRTQQMHSVPCPIQSCLLIVGQPLMTGVFELTYKERKLLLRILLQSYYYWKLLIRILLHICWLLPARDVSCELPSNTLVIAEFPYLIGSLYRKDTVSSRW